MAAFLDSKDANKRTKAVEELLAIRPVVAKGSHAILVTTVGASVVIEPDAAGGERIALDGQPELIPADLDMKDLQA